MPGLRRLTTLLRRLPRAPLLPSPSRPFASAAAAAQLQYDSDEEGWDRNPQEMVDTCGDAEGRSVQWVFMGSPGAQKHVYASRISRLLDVPCISMGSLVRQELSPRSPIYKQIANAVNDGKLVPEDIIFALLSKRLEEGYYRGETGFILDGIPRTRVQAVILDQIADIDLVVNFKSIDCLGKDHYGSGICSYCGKPCKSSVSESTILNPKLATRTQHNQLKSSIKDTKGTCVEKLCIHNEQNQLLKDYYRKQMKLLDFQVASGPRETWQGLLAALHLQHIDAVSSSSSKKLTT